MTKPVVILPHVRQSGIHRVSDDGAFRGLVHDWERLGLCEIKRSKSPFCWMGDVGKVLLYDRPTLEFLPPDIKYELGLFGNPDPPHNGRKNSYWIFWPMMPARTAAYAVKPEPFSDRSIRMIWIGSYENRMQRGRRPVQWWSPAIDFFSYGKVKKYSHCEYLRILRQARFGLCLPGYGTKCCREMEYLALGVVPVITHGVSLSYYNRMTEGTHYIYADTPEQALVKTSTMKPDDWEFMSACGRQWYKLNCSPEGSFRTTMEIIERMTE